MAILDALKKNKDAESPKKEEKKTTSKKVVEKAKTAEKKTTPKKADSSVVQGGHILTDTVLKHPHITEKAAIIAEKGVYTFEVHKDANKIEIAKAVEEIYEVKPVRVAIINLPAKRVMSRGRRGVKPGKKKALVYLKKGDKIEFV